MTTDYVTVNCVQCHQAVPYSQARFAMQGDRIVAGPFCADCPDIAVNQPPPPLPAASGDGREAPACCRQCGEPLSDARAGLGLTLCSGKCHRDARRPAPDPEAAAPSRAWERIRDREEGVAAVRATLDELLAALDAGRYRLEAVHVRADLDYLRAALGPEGALARVRAEAMHEALTWAADWLTEMGTDEQMVAYIRANARAALGPEADQ